MIDKCLSAKGICKKYKNNTVLDNLDITLEPDKIYGLIGRNGSGKTTLLSLLSAHARTTKGEVLLGDTPVWENQEMLDHICFAREITGNVASIQGMKVREYLRMASVYLPKWDDTYTKQLAELFGLDMKKNILQLSKGMTSMLTIIVALASRADYTFLDEPVAGLDEIAREQFYKLLLEEYSESHRTFVVSTHILGEVCDVFEEVMILKNGTFEVKENTQQLLERCYCVTGREDEVGKCTSGVRILRREQYGRSVEATVLLESGQSLDLSCDTDVTAVSLQKLFVALCGEEEK